MVDDYTKPELQGLQGFYSGAVEDYTKPELQSLQGFYSRVVDDYTKPELQGLQDFYSGAVDVSPSQSFRVTRTSIVEWWMFHQARASESPGLL